MQPCCNYHFLVFTNVTKMHTGSNVLFTPIFYVTTHKTFHFLLRIACGYIKYNKHRAKGWWRLYLYPADNTVLQLGFLTFSLYFFNDCIYFLCNSFLFLFRYLFIYLFYNLNTFFSFFLQTLIIHPETTMFVSNNTHVHSKTFPL